MKRFSEWITGKYIEWRGDAIGRERTISDFAVFVGVSQPLMSGWLNGTKEPGVKMIPIIAKKYPEIYDILGMSIPVESDNPLDGLPPAFRRRFLAARREYTEELSRRGITQDSPEARRIVREVFSKHGIQLTDME